MKEKNLAAIDLGTNSFHMVIVKVRSDGTTESLFREKESVRLGQGSEDYSLIQADAIERGIACLKRFKALADTHKAEIRAIGTSALREAENRDVFLKRARKEAGIRVEIINGLEEARLIYLGILQGLPVYNKRILMIDIGGGSTELLVGEKEDILFSQSLKLGAVRLTEKFFRKEFLDANDLQKCRFHIEALLFPIQETIQKLKPEIAVGSSGSVTSVGSMILAKKREKRDRLNGFEFSYADLMGIRQMINEAPTLKKRMKIPGLEEKRADIIVAGSLVLEEIFRTFRLKKCIISDFALREGIVYDTIRKWKRFEKTGFHRLDNIRSKAIQSVSNLYPAVREHSQHIAFLSMRLFDELVELHKMGKEERDYLEAASILHKVGLAISHSGYHKHSYYIIRNSENMVGFNNDEIEIVAQIARFHRKSPPKPKHAEFRAMSPDDQMTIKKLAAILRLAEALDRGMKRNVLDIHVNLTGSIVKLILKTKKKIQPNLEIYALDENKEMFEDVFCKTIEHSIQKN